MRVITHASSAHLDEFLAVCCLLSKYRSLPVIRTNDKSIIRPDDIVVDFGEMYDPSKKRYDHHHDLSLPCSLVIVLRDEFGIENVPEQIRYVDFADRFGLSKASEIFGYTQSSFIDTIILSVFSKRSVIVAGDSLHELMIQVGDSIIEIVKTYDDYLTMNLNTVSPDFSNIKANGVNVYEVSGKYVVITDIQLKVGVFVKVMRQKGYNVVGIIKPNDRGKGYDLIRVNDNPYFSPTNQKIFPVIFKHSNGFLVVVDASFTEIVKHLDEILGQILIPSRKESRSSPDGEVGK